MAGKRSLWKRVRHRTEYLFYRFLMRAIPLLPHRWLSPLARAGAWIGPRLIFWEARKARANLDLVYGDRLTKADKESILRESFGTLALTALYFFWAKNLTKKSIQDYVEFPENVGRAAEEVEKAGRGAIALLGHYGNWELMGVAVGYLDCPPLNVIVRPLKNPLLDESVNQYRCRSGNRVIEREGSMMKAVRVLRRGELLGLVFDQNVDPSEGGTFAPFLGLPAATTKAAATLSLRTGAPIIPVACDPLENARYRLRVEPPVAFEPSGDFDQDVQRLTEECNRRIEAMIQRKPGAWLWMYKRWRIRPTVERGEYPVYSKPERRLRQKAAS